MEQKIEAKEEYKKSDYTTNLESIQASNKTIQDMKESIKDACPFARECDENVKIEYSKIKSRVQRLHKAVNAFYPHFNAVHYPHFRTDTKNKVRGGLSKAWKSNLDWLAHGRHWKQLQRRMGLYGKEMVGVGEACSTMGHCVCGTLHSPGRHHLHHCPKESCKRVTVRDECARVIGVMGDVKILQLDILKELKVFF
jgi:hypothetical protein